MRLLNAHTLTFKQFTSNTPPYAILSHRWTGSEPSLSDIERMRSDLSHNQNKVYKLAQYVTVHYPRLEWMWIDSCCINQESAAELSEGVNCMFDWYRNASVCIAYLRDVKQTSDLDAFRRSVWFTRGWTLQELVASTFVVFLTESWQVIGHKGWTKSVDDSIEAGQNLDALISSITSIPQAVLHDYGNSHGISVAEKMRWMEGRQTLREEDMAYAMFGLFEVSPGANYGEKLLGARNRLYLAIEQKKRFDVGEVAQDDIKSAALPLHTIPYTRDPAFVDRRETNEIWQKLTDRGARVALIGFGGIGKTQLAISYCYRMKEQFPDSWVFWIHASTAARFDQDIRKLADDVGVGGSDAKETDVYKLVHGWLNDNRRRWMIVLDNADDAAPLFEAPEIAGGTLSTRSRLDWLPICSHGCILITTRRRAIAEHFTDPCNIFQLEPDDQHAQKLLKNKLRYTFSDSDVSNLARALEHIPLAIAQAAAYINKRIPRCTIKDYLERLDRSDRSKSSLLKIESNELRRDRSDARNSILLTWQLSFEDINTTRRSACELLSLMSFFDNQGIPDFVFKSRYELEDRKRQTTPNDAHDHDSEGGFEELFEEDVSTLRDYSFISLTPDGSLFQMHRLVQLAVQLWLKQKQQHELWETQSTILLNHVHPLATIHEWMRCRLIFPHAKLMCNLELIDKGALGALGSLMYKAGWFADSERYYREARTMAMRAIQIYTNLDGQQEANKLACVALLASTHRHQGQWQEAAELDEQVLLGRQRIFGPRHPSTLNSMDNLAWSYKVQGRLKEAEYLGLQSVQITIEVFGSESRAALLSTSNLISTFLYQERWEEAEELGTEVLKTCMLVLGPQDELTLTAMNNLGTLYNKQKRWKEAEELEMAVLQTYRTTLGPEHPNTLSSMHLLACNYAYQEKWIQAEELESLVVRGRTDIYGPQDTDTINAINCLAHFRAMRDR